MPRFGTLDVAPIAPDLPDLTAIAGPEWELADAEFLQINWEVDDEGALALTPPSLHPSIPPFASFFAVLTTGTYPAGLRDFMVRSGRYFTRLSAYGYLLTDDYPPLALD